MSYGLADLRKKGSGSIEKFERRQEEGLAIEAGRRQLQGDELISGDVGRRGDCGRFGVEVAEVGLVDTM